MEDAVAMLLVHARVNVEARVAQLGDLLSKQLDSLCRVTEDYRLIDLQLSATQNTNIPQYLKQTEPNASIIQGSKKPGFF